MSGQDMSRILTRNQTNDECFQSFQNAPDATFAEYPLTAGKHEAAGHGHQFPPRISSARSNQSSLECLEAAGFSASSFLTPLSREVLGRLSDEEVDLLISVKERLKIAQGGTLSFVLGDMFDGGPWSISERLRGKLGLIMPLLFAPNQALFGHPQAALLYPTWAMTIYQLARNFLPLMETALAQAQMLAATDPVAAEIAAYLGRHIEEERHGAEGYGEAHLADLVELGVDPKEVRRQPLPLTVATLVGCHYDWIVHRHPVALFGFLEITEGYPPPVWAIEDFITRSGLPRAGFGLLFEHADLDLRHRDELHAVLDRLPLTLEQEEVLGLSALRTADLMSRALWEALDVLVIS